MTAPVIEFRDDVTPSTVLTSLSLTGAGFGGAIVAGNASDPITFRIYNNYAAAGSIHDAINCVLTSYDDATTLGAVTTPPVIQQWLQTTVVNYDGSTTGADAGVYSKIGGVTNHAVPTNSGVIGGAGAHYIKVGLKVVVPSIAATALTSQGYWLEYDYV